MRALVAIIGLALVAGVAHAEPHAVALGFDHNLHDRDVVVSGADSIACTKCHASRGSRPVPPGHAACFGACHGPAPRPPARGAKLQLDAERTKLCASCHAETALAAPFTGRLAVPYPPYTSDPDFALAIGHQRHAAIPCTQCHTPGDHAARKGGVHARCGGCHDGGGAAKGPVTRGPPMTSCATCHTPGAGAPQPPELANPIDTVTAIFSHARHAARPGGGECLTCHAAIAATNDSSLPRPTVKDCAGCHDGKTAFATTGACTKCHAQPPNRFEVVRPETRFSHASHEAALAGVACAKCHALSAKGEPTPPDHAACVQCHADDFGARRPVTCGACHNTTEPWRPLLADRGPPPSSEFGSKIDHRAHASPCASCHSLSTATAQLRPPRGHAACTGAGCHAVATGPAPTLGDCTGCHELGLIAARTAKRAADPWSVRRAFDHAAHPAPCASCHTSLGANVVELAAPDKASCAPCHDGKTSFKLTGTSCTRCHTGARQP